MSLTPVKSSNIAAIGHDPETNTLTVQFKDGAQHIYADVSAEKHAALMGDGARDHSIGKHFHAHIKGQHKSKKLDDA